MGKGGRSIVQTPSLRASILSSNCTRTKASQEKITAETKTEGRRHERKDKRQKQKSRSLYSSSTPSTSSSVAVPNTFMKGFKKNYGPFEFIRWLFVCVFFYDFVVYLIYRFLL
jgi:hypothetical protein